MWSLYSLNPNSVCTKTDKCILKFYSYHHHICNCSLNESITWGFKVSSMWQCQWVRGLWSSNYPEPLTHRHNITPQMSGVVTAYLYSIFTPNCGTLSSNGSLVITTYPKAEYRYHVATILLLYFIQNNDHNKNCIFVKNLPILPHITSGL